MQANVTRRTLLTSAAGVAALAVGACSSTDKTAGTEEQDSEQGAGQGIPSAPSSDRVQELLSSLTLEDKIAQMIMPAIRTWEGEENGVTDLAATPELAEALARHPYGGIILFGANIVDTDQTTRLVCDLQANNAQASSATTIPYFIAADQEGGSVARLSMGTRGTGSMAIGATGADAAQNARDTGTIFGLELSALGINVNLGPCVDVIADLADAGMSTRVFSDDPHVVADCALGFAYGVDKCGVITCFKHFPGAGDGSDFPTAIALTEQELTEGGLIPYAAVIDAGADMVMTSACTFPALDDEVTLADGVTRGYLPATMSPKIVGEMLRGELGFEGVVMTDALEMDQFFDEPETGDAILPGGRELEGFVNVAERCITAGCDILLIPTDLNEAAKVAWFDGYIAGIAEKVSSGAIPEATIDDAVRRILALKEARGILDLDVSGDTVDDAIAHATKIVGSTEHHQIERAIAEQAVTLLKGADALPIEGTGRRIVILGRTASDATPITYALSELMATGSVDADAHVENNITGETYGSDEAQTHVFVDCYYDLAEGAITWSDELSAHIACADYVVCLCATWAGLELLQDSDGRMQGITRALDEAHAAGATFVLLDNNLPVDGARFPEADAVVCSYLSSGVDIDPTTGSGSDTMRAINANVPAALRAIFGATPMPGTLPINVHAMEQAADGTWGYTDEVLFARGTGAQ